MDVNKKDKFLQDVIKNNKEKNDKCEDKAFTSIISNLFLLNKWGKEKAMGLDEYDSESNSPLTLIPGHIYGFKYMTDTTTKYEKGLIKFEYLDTLPIILCVHTDGNVIHGINLNLCNLDLRALILNDVYNIDPEFFNKTASVQAHHGQIPISKRISSFFANKKNVEAFLLHIKLKYKLLEISLIYRTYSIKKILNVRFIEPWLWLHVPFINYKSSVKQSVLQMIQHVTGIKNVHI